MPPRKELCRNFMRGSCHFGERCKFLHAAQTPSTSNPYGSGVQNGNFRQQSNQQQQKPNPFGFGVQNGNQTQSNRYGFGVQTNSQAKGGFSDFGSNQSKPFENTWFRPQTNAGGSSASRQPDNQSRSHKCTDPGACKSAIAADLKDEKPLWKLTCYGHSNNGPCDIVGDISYEELRALAYDDGKRGLSLQTIVEKERTLINAKVAEFDSLIRNLNNVPLNSAAGIQSPFHDDTRNSNNPTSFSSFSNLAPSTSGATSPPINFFGQPHPSQNSPTPGSFGGQLLSQTLQNPFGRFSTGFNNNIPPSTQQNQFFSSTVSSQISNSAGNLHNGSFSGGLSMDSAKLNLNNPPADTLDGDDSIWTSETWTIGKIPESAPPAKYCR
ncbi:OLC1v1035714C1 [Oldenlandia corymbosa var. corymbosa]|uniref:OLC1v1035714C1 n=1 Tax=Oldenlandia corymbosa var. corymbosa TaxID=529605 RepID=A0AAV1CV10_OLDCO|nr:OLC1v1035714C1 [Oldenlandia corymbosa var. corymbosa]